MKRTNEIHWLTSDSTRTYTRNSPSFFCFFFLSCRASLRNTYNIHMKLHAMSPRIITMYRLELERCKGVWELCIAGKNTDAYRDSRIAVNKICNTCECVWKLTAATDSISELQYQHQTRKPEGKKFFLDRFMHGKFFASFLRLQFRCARRYTIRYTAQWCRHYLLFSLYWLKQKWSFTNKNWVSAWPSA